MTNVVVIAGIQSARITYKGRPVCTTQQLAQFYSCTEKNIGDNYANNRNRFEEGKHFVKLEGDALNLFKQGIPDEIGDPLKFTARLMLWTELGTARHAKMLTTDKAWDVYEEMEETYFQRKERQPVVDGKDRSSVLDRLPLYLFTAETVVRRRLPFSKVYSLVNLFAGSGNFKNMTREQVADVLDFCDRYALGQDTRNDWQRITDNYTKLHGTPPQQDFIQMLLLS
ncbi:MAG: ORF6N domain-containing protein [Comamonas sp.]|jgi:hypothetical protein|uniref:ORF6N domain-containing protein n=1 Tax=Comamonas sp. TaxID=34028 RepID=UPI0028324D2A|nr:ORF6N domain-containing protein [Comamonas sp.]MDR0215908.1 ORF6N domain-containing protein [Comamonas sp.]